MSDRKNLIDTIEDTQVFSVFARLMRTSGLKDLLRGHGTMTIFVPTNDAFRKIPDHVMNGWLSEKTQGMLTMVLSAHIVADRLMAATLGLSAKTAISICGTSMQFTDDKGLRVNNIVIKQRNIEATNGIIHALDSVMLPSTAAATKNAAACGGEIPRAEGDLAPSAKNGGALGDNDQAPPHAQTLLSAGDRVLS